MAVEAMKQLLKCLCELCDCNLPVLLVGDFNLPSIDWSSPALISDSDCCSVRFSVFTSRHALDQLVSEPTRGRNILDLLLCNEPFLVSTVRTGPPFSTADHSRVEFSINLVDSESHPSVPGAKSSTAPKRPDFKRANWELIQHYMNNVDWDTVFSECCTCSDIERCIYDVLYNCIELYVPSSACKYNCNDRSRR